ncbi:pathogenesis-related protein 1-like [Humulus lupulus]|uniref:pathogenesis-related protein 1-like n=1 Tax=Humulus lupulus TaxID=3486 RepID=UPI002B405D9B|nr:pathogenesis-related protein 1-like [Humulus lupulus]
MNDFLKVHNAIRAKVGVGPMDWNNTLGTYAENYADSLIKTNCEMVPSRGPYGENLAKGKSSQTSEQAMMHWASEKANYDYASNSCTRNGGCDHYTQMVWRNSIHLGCAIVKCITDSVDLSVVVCSYGPPGNKVGQRPY